MVDARLPTEPLERDHQALAPGPGLDPAVRGRAARSGPAGQPLDHAGDARFSPPASGTDRHPHLKRHQQQDDALERLSSYIPADERVATIGAAELQLQQPHVADGDPPATSRGGAPRATWCECLRMRPTGSSSAVPRRALDMPGDEHRPRGLTTIHANTPRDALSRLEMMVGMAGFDLPVWVIRKQVASAINVVVQSARLVGLRKIVRSRRPAWRATC